MVTLCNKFFPTKNIFLLEYSKIAKTNQIMFLTIYKKH